MVPYILSDSFLVYVMNYSITTPILACIYSPFRLNRRGLFWPLTMANSDKPILVVDDDPFILDVVSRYLKAKGFRVLTPTDPERDYAMAEQQVPRLIISALAMPGW